MTGTPSGEDLNFIGDESALKYIKSRPKRNKQSWASMYPKASKSAIDLLSKMLVFNPEKRLTVEECLAHEYLQELHSPDEEPLSEELFDWSFDNFELTKDKLQTMVYQEACHFHPDK